MKLTLPWPPQANHYYTVVRGRKILGKAGRKYRDDAANAAAFTQTVHFAGRVRVTLVAFQPDRRRRDLDNLLKPVQDRLTAGKIWLDDSQVDDLRIIRGGVDKDNPRIEVEVEQLTPTKE